MKQKFEPFSELSTKQCMEILKENGNNLDLYTPKQISEMKLVGKNGIFVPTLMVKSIDGIDINTGISIEQLEDWKNK
jgi:hypothetical protein